MMSLFSKYSRTRTIILVSISYIIGAFATFWTIFTFEKDGFPMWIKILAGCIYLFLIGIAVFLTIKRWKYGVEGIVRVHIRDNDYSEIKHQFNKAKHSIEIIVYHGNNLLNATKGGLIDALKRDVDVKILIAEKDSVLLKEVWEMEGNEKPADRNRAWKSIRVIKDQADDKTCSIRYYKYNTQARYALIIVDGNWAWWTPYHPGIDIKESSSFVLKNTGKKSIIHECKKHFRTLWIQLENEQNNVNTILPVSVNEHIMDFLGEEPYKCSAINKLSLQKQFDFITLIEKLIKYSSIIPLAAINPGDFICNEIKIIPESIDVSDPNDIKCCMENSSGEILFIRISKNIADYELEDNIETIIFMERIVFLSFHKTILAINLDKLKK